MSDEEDNITPDSFAVSAPEAESVKFFKALPADVRKLFAIEKKEGIPANPYMLDSENFEESGLLDFLSETDGEIMKEFLELTKDDSPAMRKLILQWCCELRFKSPKGVEAKMKKYKKGIEIGAHLRNRKLIRTTGGCAPYSRVAPRLVHTIWLRRERDLSWAASHWVPNWPAAGKDFAYSGSIVMISSGERTTVKHVLVALGVVASMIFGGAFDPKKTVTERELAMTKATEAQSNSIVASQCLSPYPGMFPRSAVGAAWAGTTAEILKEFCVFHKLTAAQWYEKPK